MSACAFAYAAMDGFAGIELPSFALDAATCDGCGKPMSSYKFVPQTLRRFCTACWDKGNGYTDFDAFKKEALK